MSLCAVSALLLTPIVSWSQTNTPASAAADPAALSLATNSVDPQGISHSSSGDSIGEYRNARNIGDYAGSKRELTVVTVVVTTNAAATNAPAGPALTATATNAPSPISVATNTPKNP